MKTQPSLLRGAVTAVLALSTFALLAPGQPAAASSAPPAATAIKTGGVRMIPIHGGKYQVWTKKVGHGPIKVLLLHGGPGVTHEYLECFEDFLPPAEFEFYYYDQLGSHYSSQPDDPSLWTMERFVEEVEQVRLGLGLDHFVLYGQSWGGMLGIEYALKYGSHLRGLVISSIPGSMASYLKYVNELKGQLPADLLATMNRYEAKQDFTNPEYQRIVMETIYPKHLCRVKPLPNAVDRTFQHMNAQVYNTMQGANEFLVTGNLKDWDRWQDLPKIKVPTLLIGAKYDEVNPADMRRMGQLIPHARVHICENGSHLCMWDDQESYFAGLLGYLRGL